MFYSRLYEGPVILMALRLQMSFLKDKRKDTRGLVFYVSKLCSKTSTEQCNSTQTVTPGQDRTEDFGGVRLQGLNNLFSLIIYFQVLFITYPLQVAMPLLQGITG